MDLYFKAVTRVMDETPEGDEEPRRTQPSKHGEQDALNHPEESIHGREERNIDECAGELNRTLKELNQLVKLEISTNYHY